MNIKTLSLEYLPSEIIQNKRNNHSHSESELNWFITQYIDGKIPDYQMSAWLMAVNFNGMNLIETANYTKILIESGDTLSFNNDGRIVIDKHSTGGVGDKVSLILGPILACMDYKIPMLAGRSLEHTGGTIDKLESIPNFKIKLPLNQFKENVHKIGFGIMMQSNEICPADGKIYALRDVTATVNSLPLICGSILSKKIAEGLQTLVLDIKTGNGAFMKNLDQAKKLGQLMTKIGQEFDLNVIPAYTGMDQPLGKTAGLWCEVMESFDFLTGNYSKDLYQVIFHLFQKFNPENNTIKVFDELITSGKALKKFIDFIEIQGGKFIDIEQNNANKPKFQREGFLKKECYIKSIDTKEIGFALAQLGAGRPNQKSKLDYSCGIKFHAKIGEKVDRKTPIFKLFGANEQKILIAEKRIMSAFKTSQTSIKSYNPIF